MITKRFGLSFDLAENQEANEIINNLGTTMHKVSNEVTANTSNNESVILHALNSSNQRNVAEKIQVDASTLSRMKNDKKSNGLTDIEFLGALLTAIGLKVVPESDVYCSPQIAEATRVMLAHAFTSPEYMRILFK